MKWRLSYLQFSLHSFLIVAILFGMVLAWIGKVQHRVQQRHLVSQLQSRDAGVGYDYQVASS